ncbi:IS1595 family transposase [Teredinibacter haidensis]|uniref:IS1595 family transposase n=1 Tax=Teredinibacter haidensis TaxID=2731755 RepID=UPI000948C93A|nr:IS1595 family transposase [Teredinibacter haidensis]
MAQNTVQFQKGMSLPEFMGLYGTEEQCFEALFNWRWPNGFFCPECGCTESCRLSTRKLQQCNKCHHQTSITAGTIFQATKLPLRMWFLGMYFITQDKKGVSALELMRRLGIGYKSAWRMKQKLMQVMLERDNDKPLSGFIELDDAYLGGERRGGKVGRGSENKTPFVAAVQTTKQGQPEAIKLQIVDGFRSRTISKWASKAIKAGSTIVSDGLQCFNAVTEAGCEHDKIVCGGGKASVEEIEFYWVNTVLGNLKSALRSTYHSISPKHAQRYLAEFQYRFNRRYNLSALMPRLAYVSLRTPPITENILRL